jgi:hypothetical protein
LIIIFTWILSGWVPLLPADGTQIIRIKPEILRLNPGQEANITIAIDSASNLYGFELHLKFDSTIIQVVDSDSDLPGVQVHPGDIFDLNQTFLVINQVDNETGEITYAITLLAPASPVTGDGTLIQFDIQAAAVGTSALELVDVIMASPDGEALPFTEFDGQVIVEADEIGSPIPTQIPVSSPTPPQSFTETPSPTTTLTLVVLPSPTNLPSTVTNTNTSIPLPTFTTTPLPQSIEGTIIPTIRLHLTETVISQTQVETIVGTDLATTQGPEFDQRYGISKFVSLVLPILGVLILIGIVILLFRRALRG